MCVVGRAGRRVEGGEQMDSFSKMRIILPLKKNYNTFHKSKEKCETLIT